MADDVVSIRIRARGGREASREIGGVGKSLISVGRASQIAGRGLTGATRAAGGFGRTITSWRTAFVVGGLGSIGVAAARMGLQFNASMEQNEVAFTQFLGSSRAARGELGFLQRTAAVTPFELPQITTAARRLMAFGFSAKDTNGWLSTIGDTIAGMGGGAQEIDQLVTAIGQIRSKGRLQGDELMQLSELGVVNRGKLAKDLGISTLELMSGRANVSGTRALRALRKQFDDTFGGQAAKQSRTFNGQLSTLHDNLNMTLGTITRPGFKLLENRVFPVLGKTTDAINKTFSRKDLDFGEKVHVSEGIARRNLAPLVRAGRTEIGKLHLGQKLSDEFEAAVPRLADTAGRAAPKVAGALVRGFFDAGPYGKMFAAGLLLKKLGVFRLAGTLAAEAFLKRYIPTVVAGEAAANAAGAGGGGVAALRKAAPWLLTRGGPIGAFLLGSGLAGGPFGSEAGLTPEVERSRLRRGHGGLSRDGTVAYYRRHRSELDAGTISALSPEQRRALGVGAGAGRARARGPRARGATHQTIVVKLPNGRELARVVNRANADNDARNNRRTGG